MTTETATKWQVEGTLLIACNCEYGCPCNFNAPPSHGNCDGQWLWHVEKGSFGDVSLDGLTWTVTAKWPKAIHEGGGRAMCFYDESASEEQRAAIEALVGGGQGGPWAIFSNTYELEAFRPVPVEISIDGLTSRVKLGDAMQLELETIKNPVSGAEVHPSVHLPEGLVCYDADLGASRTFTVNDGIEWDHSGQYAAVAPFSYAS